ncbi:P-loop containing nucleoside triphosphate hydrolase protein [Fennellomyces sp. T-0311]|nr:P-loop containing nucleoside triphosphate hydrolase protein [Fennellomyces sp. T-0311]
MSDDHSPSQSRRFHPFFRPSSTTKRDRSPSSATSPSTKIKVGKTASWRPNEKPKPIEKPKLASVPVHPFFAKHQPKPEKQPPTLTPSPTLLPPKPKPIRKDHEPLWPDAALFQGGHICAPTYPVAKTHSNTPRIRQQRRRSEVYDTIRDDALRYFSRKRPLHKPKQRPEHLVRNMSLTQIRQLIETVYPSCKKSPGCQALLDNMGRRRRQVQGIPWTEIYRPAKVVELLGNHDDNVYLRDWLLQMKVVAPSAFEHVHKAKKKKSERVFYDDEDFVPGRQPQPVKQEPTLMQSNLILLVGDRGAGKTAAVYTAAEDAGYEVFEIHPGLRRTGKDLFAYVGEMTESHLVSSHPSKKRKSELDVIDVVPTPSSEPKQSLVLLEEVDTLYEDDRGFWTSVLELAQKSKRPIIMTCNDLGLVPFDTLFLQGILEYRYPDNEELMAYLHLICFSEGYYVHPADLAGLCVMMKNDLRQLIMTLELWCTQDKSPLDDRLADGYLRLHDCPGLFEQYLGIACLDSREERLAQLFRIQQTKSGVNLIRFHEKCIEHNYGSNHVSNHTLLDVSKEMCRASSVDAMMDASYRLHECDEYGPSQDQILNYTILEKLPTDLAHWQLGEDMATDLWVQMYGRANAELRTALEPTVWDELMRVRALTADQCYLASKEVLPWRAYLSAQLTMTDYIPRIRDMCVDDQGVVGRGRALRTRRKQRYLPLTEEGRKVLVNEPKHRDPTDIWCEMTMEWTRRFGGAHQ